MHPGKKKTRRDILYMISMACSSFWQLKIEKLFMKCGLDFLKAYPILRAHNFFQGKVKSFMLSFFYLGGQFFNKVIRC